MFGLSTSHLLILGFIALLFGSRRLPELGASMGNAIRAFKAATEGQIPIDPQQPTQQSQQALLSQTLQSPEKSTMVVDAHEEKRKVT